MTIANHPHLPIPAAAVVGDWCEYSDFLGDTFRCLTWSRHDGGGVVVAVQGEQYGDGRVERYVAVEGFDVDLRAAAARQLAAALLDAADALDGLR
jgi:hypothetical protein